MEERTVDDSYTTRRRTASTAGQAGETRPSADAGPTRALGEIGSVRLAVAAAGLGDLATTAVVLTAPSYPEANVVLSALAALHPGLAISLFAAFVVGLVGLCWADVGWTSDVAGAYVGVAMGVSSVNNVVAFATGVSPLGALLPTPALFIAYVFPACGLLLGTLVAYRTRPGPSTRQVVTVWTAVCALALALPAAV